MALLDDFFLDYLRKTGVEIAIDYLRDSGIRFLRTDWKNKANPQAQETATTLYGIPRLRNVLPQTDDDGNPVTVPTIGGSNLVIPPFVLGNPLSPFNPPVITFPPFDPGVPPTFPPGPGIPPFPPDDPDTDPDDDTGNPGPPGVPGPTGPGGPIPDPPDFPDEDDDGGGGGGGGGVTVNSATAVARTTSEVTAREGEDWGSGTAELILYDTDAWTGSTSVTVRNSASSEVGNGKYVQLKMIAELWFVDVEDCSQSDDE